MTESPPSVSASTVHTAVSASWRFRITGCVQQATLIKWAPLSQQRIGTSAAAAGTGPPPSLDHRTGWKDPKTKIWGSVRSGRPARGCRQNVWGQTYLGRETWAAQETMEAGPKPDWTAHARYGVWADSRWSGTHATVNWRRVEWLEYYTVARKIQSTPLQADIISTLCGLPNRQTLRHFNELTFVRLVAVFVKHTHTHT